MAGDTKIAPLDNRSQEEAMTDDTKDDRRQKEVMAGGSTISEAEAEDPPKGSAKRALEVAARRTKAAADAAVQRAADAAGEDMDPEEMDEIVAARQNAAVEQASEVAAALKKQGTASIPTARAQVEPGISPQRPDPTAAIITPMPEVIPPVDRRVECQKFLYEVANQTALNATEELAAAEDLATSSRDDDAREEARDHAARARFNLGLAKQMAEAAQSPATAFQAVAAIQNIYSECDPKDLSQ